VKRTRLKRVSTKQAAINRSYKLLKAEYMKAHPECQVCGIWDIWHIPHTVHHVKGRGKYTLDVSTFMTVCSACHYWIHFINPKEARKEGYLK
jgi:transposase InsO family protein